MSEDQTVDYASMIAGEEPEDTTDEPEVVAEEAPADQAEPVAEQTEETEEPELPDEQNKAFRERMERERAKLEQQLRAEIEADVQQKLIQQLQGVQQPQLNPQQAQQQLLAQLQRDPINTFYQIAQYAAQQTAAPLVERNKQMERQQRVADLALKYGEDVANVADHMKPILDKHPEWWDTDEGLEYAYKLAKFEASQNLAKEAVSRERQQQQQINEAKSQARAAGGQAQSTEGMSKEDMAAAYADQLLRVR